MYFCGRHFESNFWASILDDATILNTTVFVAAMGALKTWHNNFTEERYCCKHIFCRAIFLTIHTKRFGFINRIVWRQLNELNFIVCTRRSGLWSLRIHCWQVTLKVGAWNFWELGESNSMFFLSFVYDNELQIVVLFVIKRDSLSLFQKQEQLIHLSQMFLIE